MGEGPPSPLDEKKHDAMSRNTGPVLAEAICVSLASRFHNFLRISLCFGFAYGYVHVCVCIRFSVCVRVCRGACVNGCACEPVCLRL